MTVVFVSSLLIVFMITNVLAKTIDNKLTETPTVKCGPDSIQISGATEDDFEGVLFIKNWRRTSGCYNTFQKARNGTKNPTYSIPLGELSRCGLELRRHHETRELEVFTVFIFSFHPSFVTMSDRAFAVHCIFQQQTITVATKFNFIDDITTRATFSGMHRIPKPSLAIVSGRVPDEKLPQAGTVHVGEPLMFVWHIAAPSEIYGLQVIDCMAQTLDGRRMTIIENGCTTDDIILSNIQYNEENQRAFSDAMAFKFPDAEDVWVKCSVRTCIQHSKHILIKDGLLDDHICQNEIKCGNRKKKSVDELSQDMDTHLNDNSVNIIHKKLTVLDVYAHPDSNLTTPVESRRSALKSPESGPKYQLCMLKSVYASSAAFLLTLYLSTLASGGVLLYSMKRKRGNDLNL